MQSALMRGRLEAARRDAEQAQANVQDLRAQVNAAETESQQRQEKVRTLSGQARQTDPTYSARQETASTAVPVKTQQFIVGLFNATSDKRVASGVSLKANPDASPVINNQGQTTGRIVNISA
jgi:Tfp pilus assembly protein FimV